MRLSKGHRVNLINIGYKARVHKAEGCRGDEMRLERKGHMGRTQRRHTKVFLHLTLGELWVSALGTQRAEGCYGLE